ncbi:hypothetical protein NEIRO03_1241 [Nematocida sp. AWRm78]|nr:hypothetical protein NEIRO02_2518 [Nematocida sp. AWRm79]KAI5183662.1 hypothetical protein NEIRO03_1241 [Nematocida sp. AWRm78]
MHNLFIKEKLKSISIISLPGGYASYTWSEDSLYLRESPQRKEIHLEEKRVDSKMFIAVQSTTEITIYGCVSVCMTPILSDFYIPMPSQSVYFYDEMRNRLNGDISDGIEEYFNKYVKSAPIPFYPVPLTTHSGVFKYYNFKELKNTQKRTFLVKKIRIEDDVPETDSSVEETVRSQIGDNYSMFKDVLNRAFSQRPIWPIKGIEKYFKEHQKDFQSWKWSSVKNILACIAYTYSTGPWKKLWVKYGYDPRKDPSTYKYQVYVWKNVSKAFVIMDNPEVYDKIERTEGFTQKVFSVRTGFLTDQALNYMHKKFSEMSMPTPEKSTDKLDLFDNLEFETLDD